MRKRLLIGLLCLLFVGGLTACNTSGITFPTSATSTSTSTTTSENPSSTTTTSETELNLQLMEIYSLAISSGAFAGTYEEWLDSVRGPAGKEVLLQVAGGFIQWQYTGDTAWNNLISLASLTGANGADGKNLLLQVASGYIQWKLDGAEVWNNLIELTLLAGPRGADGKTVEFQVATGFIQWRYIGDTSWVNLIELSSLTGPAGTNGTNGTNGTDGKEVSLRVFEGFIQWQYVGETTWKNLVELTTLQGPQGLPGDNGKSITIRVHEGFIQWQYVGETTWTSLIDLATLRGPAGEDGVTPTIEINQEGYWVINGVATTYKATGEGGSPVSNVTVEFDPTGGELPLDYGPIITVPKGNSVDLPIPIKDGFRFMGWITGTTVNDLRFTSYTPFTRNTKLYASWELDLTSLLDFFEQARSMNLTGERSLIGQATFGEEIEKVEQFSTIKLQMVGNKVYTYEIENNRYFYQGEWQEDPIRHRYTIYDNPKEDQAGDIVIIQQYQDELFNIYFDYDDFEHPIDLRMFDVNLFVKRPGLQLYDYPVTPEILALFGFDELTDISFTTLTCVFDLANQTFVITMIGEFANMGSSVQVDLLLTLSLKDVNATVIEIPLPEVKDDLSQRLLNDAYEIRTYRGYAIATEASRAEFDEFIEEGLFDISAINNLFELTYVFEYLMEDMWNFYFEVDPIQQMRYNAKIEMEDTVAMLSESATVESILAMEALLADYIELIAPLNTFEALNQLVQAFHEEVQDYYIFDTAKQELMDYQTKLIHNLEVYRSAFSELFLIPTERSQFFNSYYDAIDAIEETTNKADALLVYQATIQNWMSKNYSLGDLSEVKEWLLMQLESAYGMALNFIEDDTTEIDGIFLDFETNLGLATDVFVILELGFEAYDSINALVITNLRLYALQQAQNIYNQTIAKIIPEAMIEAQRLYTEVSARIQNAVEIHKIYQLLDDFHWNMSYLPVDDFLQSKQFYTDQIIGLVNYLYLVATDESYLIIEGLVDQFLLDVDALIYEDYEALEILFDTAHSAILNAFIEKPEVAELRIAKEQAENLLYNVYWTVYDHIEFDSIEQEDELYYGFVDHLQGIYQAKTVLEVELAYDEVIFFLASQNLTFFNLEQRLDEEIFELWNFYDEYTTIIDQLDPEIEVYLEAQTIAIKTLTNPYQMVSTAIQTYNTLHEMFLTKSKTHLLLKLEAIYLEYLPLLLLESLDEAEELYVHFQALIAQETNLWEFFYTINNFIYDLEQLPMDPLEFVRHQAKMELNNQFTYLSHTASEDSLLMMESVLTEYLQAIQAAVDEMEIDNTVYLGIDALNIAYIPNPEISVFNQTKYDWLHLFDQLYIYLIELIDDPEMLPSFEDWYIESYNQVNQSQDLSEIEFFSLKILEKLDFLNLTFFDDFDYIIADYTDFLNEEFSILTYNVGEIDSDSLIYLNSILTDLTSITNPMDLILHAEFSLWDVRTYLLEIISPVMLTRIDNQYNQLTLQVADVDIPMLTLYYNKFHTMIQNSILAWRSVNFYYEFIYYANELTFDPLKIQIADAIESLYFELEMHSQTATPESILAMTEIVEAYVLLLWEVTTEDEIQPLMILASEELSDAKVEDAEKLAFVRAQWDFINFQTNIVNMILQYGSVANPQAMLWDILDSNYNAVMNVDNYDDLDDIRNSFLLYLSQLQYVWSVTEEELITELEARFYNDFYNAKNYTNGFSYEIYPKMIEIFDLFDYNTNHVQTIMDYFDYREDVNIILTETMIDYFISRLDYYFLNFSWYMETLEDQLALTELYTFYYTEIVNSQIWDTPIYLVGAFYNEANLLPKSNLSYTKHYYAWNLENKVLLLSETATEGSITMMYQIAQTAIDAIFNYDVLSEIDVLYVDAIDDIDAGFEVDPAKDYLDNQKMRLKSELNMIFNYYFNQLVTDYFNFQVYNEHLTYLLEIIDQIDTTAELFEQWDLLIDEYMNSPVTLELEYQLAFVDLLLQMVEGNYTYYQSQLDTIPEYLVNLYENTVADLSDIDLLLTAYDQYMLFYHFEKTFYDYLHAPVVS